MRFIFLVLFCLGFSAAPASAALDQAGADTLKKQIMNSLQYYILMGKIPGGQGLKLSGDITVTPMEKFYQVKVPGAQLVSDQGIADLGTIIINASPSKDGAYATSVAFPKKMTMRDKSMQPLMEVVLGSQKFSGLWYPDLQSYTKVDAEYKNVTLTDLDTKEGNMKMSINDFKSILNLNKNTDGTWSGPAFAEVSGFGLNVSDKQTGRTASITVDKSNIRAQYDKMDAVKSRDLKDHVRALLEKNNDPKPEDISGILTDIVSQGNSLLDGMAQSFETNGIKIDIQPGKSEINSKPINITIAKAGSGFSAKGLQQDKGNAGLKLRIENLAVSGIPADIAGLIPNNGNIDISTDNLPMRDISKSVGDVLSLAINSSMTAQNTAPKGNSALEGQLQKMANDVPMLLAQSGASLSIRDTYIKAQDISTMVQGNFKAVAADKGVRPVGKLDIVLEGVDELMHNLQVSAKNNPDMAPYLQGLFMIQMMGKPDTNTAGKSLRKFALEMTADGRTLMNGADLSAVTQMIQGGMGGGIPAQPQ